MKKWLDTNRNGLCYLFIILIASPLIDEWPVRCSIITIVVILWNKENAK